jgi:hypothetical protein
MGDTSADLKKIDVLWVAGTLSKSPTLQSSCVCEGAREAAPGGDLYEETFRGKTERIVVVDAAPTVDCTSFEEPTGVGSTDIDLSEDTIWLCQTTWPPTLHLPDVADGTGSSRAPPNGHLLVFPERRVIEVLRSPAGQAAIGLDEARRDFTNRDATNNVRRERDPLFISSVFDDISFSSRLIYPLDVDVICVVGAPIRIGFIERCIAPIGANIHRLSTSESCEDGRHDEESSHHLFLHRI